METIIGINLKKPVAQLEDHIGYWLRFVSNQVSHAFSVRLAARDVTVAEWVILRELYDQLAVRPSTLAERLGMTRGAISKLVDRLEAKSLLARATNTEDRRYQALSLTPAGHALVPQLSALADANDAEFFGHLPPDERTALEAAMKEIVRRLKLKTIPTE